MLAQAIEAISPDYIFLPFRYDRHPDHLAVHHALRKASQRSEHRAHWIEYFVYYRWRLLPDKDIRAYIRPEYLKEVDISDVSGVKREALDLFKTQTTIYYPWQTRPILTPQLLDEECRNPELFLVHSPYLHGTAVFSRAVFWIRIAHRLEPFLQRWKYYLGVYLKRLFRNDARE